ncbi:MAG: sigma-70 family RNA polymerase sigma factor [Phycisphaerales bacterium]|nr:sigma-70 family RNA polymerase sigma factor [Phycisphaerales bacterium]
MDLTRTTTALLDGLHDPDNAEAWTTFDTRYRPILFGLGRRLGLADADAADIAQETILQFIKEYGSGRYDRARGRLRSWLLGIARTRIAGIHRKRSTRREAAGASAIDIMPDEATMTTIWDAERRREILRTALDALRTKTRTADRTIRAFELLVLHQQPVAAVAAELGMSDHDVYLAKSRVTERLRDLVAQVEHAYDEDA